jgi:hypothetical protein
VPPKKKSLKKAVDDGGGHSNSLMNNFIALGLGYNRQSIKILLRRN